MPALESNTSNIYGVHIRESANDGSDFSNAAADYRVLFVGEDGLFHLKDSAGTVTTPSASSGAVTSSGLTMATARLLGRTTASTGAIEEITVGSGLSLSAGSLTATGGSFTAPVGDDVIRTAGDVSLTGTTAFTDVTGASITITTQARRCLIGFVGSGYSNNTAGTFAIDFLVDGTSVTSGNGVLTQSQHSVASESMNLGAVWMTTTTLSAASHTFKVQMKTFNSAHTFTINASTSAPYQFWVAETTIAT